MVELGHDYQEQERRDRLFKSVVDGSAGKSPDPMSAEDRIQNYIDQNGGRPLTAAQERRIRKSARKDIARHEQSMALRKSIEAHRS